MIRQKKTLKTAGEDNKTEKNVENVPTDKRQDRFQEVGMFSTKTSSSGTYHALLHASNETNGYKTKEERSKEEDIQ